MANQKLKGFVIREVPVGEADRIISILSADSGLVSASVRGARRTKSQFLMPTQIFALSEFDLFYHKGHYTVNSAELIESFQPLHQDLDRLVCASHLAEVLLDCTRDAAAQPELYRLWAYSVQALQSLPDVLLTVHIAQWRLMSEIGFAPCLDSCVVCSGPITGTAFFSLQSCGATCSQTSCRQKANDAQPVAAGTLNCLKYCQNAPLERLFNIQLSQPVRQEFIRISEKYLTQQMEKPYTRLQMLQSLGEFAFHPGSDT